MTTPSQEKLQYFTYEHLSGDLRTISAMCASLAQTIEEEVPDGPQKTLGLQKLLEAKDCFVRAALPKSTGPGQPPLAT